MPERSPLDRLPHSGTARLPQRVTDLVPSLRVTAERTLAPHDDCLNASGRLPSMLLVELMAQTCGLLIDEADGEPARGDYAVLAGIKRMHLHGAAAAGETVEVSGRLSRRLGDLYLVDCSARAGGRDLAHGALQIRRVRAAAP